LSALTCNYDKIVPMNAPQHHPRLLLEEIAIELLAAHEPDPALPVLSIFLEGFKLQACRSNLSAQATLGLEAPLANICVMQEVSNSQP